MKITTETTEGTAVIRFCGAADVAVVDEIRKALGESMSSCCHRVVCDFSELSFICSDALGAFISAHEQARMGGGFVRLLSPQERIADILATTQLDRLFDVYDCLEDALKA